MNVRYAALAVLALSSLMLPMSASANCASGTVSVRAAQDPAFDGYWEYTLEMSWDSPKSLSHLDIFVGLENLVCACEAGLMAFDGVAGSSEGVEDGTTCALDYKGEYHCAGDPSLPDEMAGMATVKFDPITEPCDAGKVGGGTFVFYSLIAPAPESNYFDALVIKNGNGACTGDLSGFLPAADCALPVEDTSFGAVKARH